MKKIILLLFFLVGLTNCTKSQNDDNELIKRIPESSAVFASFDTSTPAYKRYVKSPWFFDVSEKITKVSQNESFLATLQPEERENFVNTVNELTKNFKDSGFYPVNGSRPDIKRAVFFLNINGDTTNGGVYALGYDDVDLTKKVDLIKSKLSKNNLFKETMVAGVNGLQLANPKNPLLEDFSISAKNNKLAFVSDEKLAENFYADSQTNTKSILTNSIFQSIEKEFPKDDIINTFFIDVPTLLERFASFITETMNKSNLNTNDLNNLDINNIKELISINPVSSIVSVTSMPSEENLHSKILISLKDKKHPTLDVLLEPVAEKAQSNIIKELPKDVAMFLNIDGSFLSKIIHLIETNKDYQMTSLGIAAFKNLIMSVKSITLTAKDKIKSSPVQNPSFGLILESTSGKDILNAIKDLTRAFGISWLNKEIANHDVDYIVLPIGLTICMTNDISGLYLTTSEEFLGDIFSKGEKIYDILPEKTKKNINENALITSFVSFSKISGILENVISELKMYSLSQDTLTEEALAEIKGLNEYVSTISLNKDSVEYEQDYFINN